MTEKRTYTGGCHCRSIRYEVAAAISEVASCNCSFCSKVGALWTFVPATDFRLISGDDNLTDYQFNKKYIHHVFCKVCGVRSFSRGKGRDGTEMIGLNVRCLDECDIASIPVKQVDGKSL